MTIDKESPTWCAVRAHAEVMLADHLSDLESQHTPMEDVQMLRGRIAALRDVLKLADTKPAAPIENAPLY